MEETKMMATVERYIEMLDEDGKNYNGYIKINRIRFDYNFKMKPDAPSLFKNIGEVRQTFQLTLNKDGEGIDLDNDEYIFFAETILSLVVVAQDMYGREKFSLSRRPSWQKNGFALESEGNYNFSQVQCALLNRPKFGCGLTEQTAGNA